MFKIVKKDINSRARKGILLTGHGQIKTPFFMPIATRGAVKGVSSLEILKTGAQIILSNTYHLYLRPGEKLVKKAGGLHKFMNWEKPILTDSGGYQVFSLAKFRKISGRGVRFRSHIDGKEYLLTPEKAIKIQQDLGSDIVMVLDECVSYPSRREYIENSVKLTTRWAERCKKENSKLQTKKPLLFGIVQGGIYKDLREKSAKDLVELNFDGYAMGGLAVGEPRKKMFEMIDFTTNFLPENKPCYLMGVGMPEEIVRAVSSGCDMFDCVIPSRNARHGYLFKFKMKNKKLKIINEPSKFYDVIHIKNSKFRNDFTSLESKCDCYTCKNFSKAYLHHLFKVQDFLGQRLATIHNIRFYTRLMEKIRQEI